TPKETRMSKQSLALALALAIGLGACKQSTSKTSSESGQSTTTTTTATTTPAAAAQKPAAAPALPGDPGSGQVHKLASGLQYDDLKSGTGKMAEPGMNVSVHYTGWLLDGTKFDSSVDRGQPFKFQLGGGQVIQGWDEGVKGMRIGGKRKLTIPPDLGYGPRGTGPIPPNATLVFDVELLDVQ